jgi:flagellar hook-length control protein FliK
LTNTPGLPTTVVQSAQKNSQEEAATTVAVEADSSSDPDAPDSESVAPSTPVQLAATDQTDATSLADPSHSTQVAGMIDQSSVATFAQSVAGDSPASNVNGASARTAAGPSNPGAKFVAENHPNIVQSVKTQLLPTGGTMRLRLDPPELGAMQVSVHVKDGVVTASFETSNDQATKMLSHSLGQLKQALESQGITVGKMHVQQSARNESAQEHSTDGDPESSQSKENTSSSQQDEQRREALRRMWERLSIGGDPLDLVA